MPETQAKSNVMRSAKSTVDRFKDAWDYAQQNHHRRWERNWKLYNNKRALVGYKGITNTFVPMTFGTVETITAALCSGRPSIDFVPQDMYSYIQSYYKHGNKPDLKALNGLFDYYWECDNWDTKTIKTVRMGLLYGTACEWVYWDGDKPRIMVLNPRDAIIDPTLSDPMQLISDPDNFYTGRRYMTTLDALKAVTLVDPDKGGEAKPRFKNLDKVTAGKETTGEETAKELKDMQLGSISNADDQIEVIEIWDGKTIKSIANRSVTIEDRENKLGMHCLVIHRFIADENVIYGKAIVDPIANPQELLNDVTNQRVDAVTDALNPQFELDPAYASWLPKMKNLPSTGYPFKPGSMQYLVKPRVDSAPFTETMGLKNDIREATASDQVVKGVSQDSNATATEINAQVNQAGERFEIYVRMLEREGLYQRAKIVFKLMLTYVKDMQLVPQQSQSGPKFRKFDPNQFDHTYEPQIRLEASVKNAKQQQTRDSMQIFTQIIQDPTNNLWQAKKILYPKMYDLSEDELDLIIGKDDPAQAAAGAENPLLPTATPTAPPPEPPQPSPKDTAGLIQDSQGNVHESADLVKLYLGTTDEALKAQIVNAMGFTPTDPTTMEAKNLEQQTAPAPTQIPAEDQALFMQGGVQ